MRNERLIEACNLIIQGFTMFRDSIIESYEKQEKKNEGTNGSPEPKTPCNEALKDLAHKVAETYRTTHKGSSVDDMYNDIKSMAGNDKKYTYLVNWLSKSYSNALGNFFSQPDNKKKELIYNALTQYEAEVREVLQKKFA